MYKILLTLLALLITSNVAFARTCLPFAIQEALKYNGQPANWRIIDWELGKEEGYYAVDSFKKLKINYKIVKEITKFPVIVEVKGHAYVVLGEIGKYWKVKDTLCRDEYCAYLKTEVKKKHIKYYYINGYNVPSNGN